MITLTAIIICVLILQHLLFNEEAIVLFAIVLFIVCVLIIGGISCLQ